MSLAVRRRIIIVCVVVATAGFWLNVALILSGHPGRYSAASMVCGALGVVFGLLYLRSTRGQS